MTPRRAILAILLSAALPASAGDVRAWLRPPTVSGGTVVERALRSPKIAGIWDAAQGLGYDGTNVATWTDAAFGNVGTATGALQRAYYEADTFGGYGAVVFSGAQAFNLASPLEMSNSTTIVIGYRATSANIFYPLGRSDVDSPPTAMVVWNNNTTYYHPGVSATGTTATGTGGWTNYLCVTTSNDGGPTTTNSYQIRLTGTNWSSMVYKQATPGTTINRIGGRKTERTVGKISLILHFQPALTAAELAEFESLAIAERFDQ